MTFLIPPGCTKMWVWMCGCRFPWNLSHGTRNCLSCGHRLLTMGPHRALNGNSKRPRWMWDISHMWTWPMATPVPQKAWMLGERERVEGKIKGRTGNNRETEGTKRGGGGVKRRKVYPGPVSETSGQRGTGDPETSQFQWVFFTHDLPSPGKEVVGSHTHY